MRGNEDRLRRVDIAFEEYTGLDDEGRGALLARLRAEDPDLHRALQRLLRLYEESGDRLSPVLARAAEETLRGHREGASIGAYRIESEIGYGGMGTVYRARRADAAFEKLVAVKLVRGGVSSERLDARFQAEREILARLEHPNIARLLDAGATDDGVPYLVMEYVAGLPLLAYCSSRQLPPRERLRLFLKLCDAVSYAHRRLVVHRDIKPANVLVSGEGVPKLLDFGVGKLLDPDAGGVTTRTGESLLTPQYASPEQVRGEAASVPADVYGLGATLYELLSGQPPHRFSSSSPHDWVRIICDTECRAPSQALRDLDPAARERFATACGLDADDLVSQLAGDLDAIVLEAVRKDSAERYGSPGELAADITRFLGGKPVEARQGNWRYRTTKFVRRHRVPVALGTAALATLLGFTAWVSVLSLRLSRETERAHLEAATAEQTSQFLMDMFREADPMQLRGTDITVEELLDHGARRLDASLADQPQVRARLVSVLANVNHNMGRYEQAEALLHDGIAAAREVADVDREFELLAELGDVQRAAQRHDESIATLESALALVTGRDPQREALARRLLAGPLFAQGNFARAKQEVSRAVAYHEAAGSRTLEAAEAWNRLGEVLHYQREDQEGAIAALRRAIPLFGETVGEDHLFYVRAEVTAAGALCWLGRFDEAEPLAVHAAETSLRVLPPGHVGIGRALNQLALIKSGRGRVREAIELKERAVAVYREAAGDPRLWVEVAEKNLFHGYLEAGDLEEAEGVARRRLPNITEAAPDPSWVRTAWVDLATVLARRGKLGEAREVVDDLLAEEEEPSSGTRLAAALVLAAEGRLDAAQEEARALLPSLKSQKSRFDCLMLLGRLALVRGDAAGAADRLREAREGFGERFPQTHPLMVRNAVLLADAVLRLGRVAEAKALLQDLDPVLAEFTLGDPDRERYARLAGSGLDFGSSGAATTRDDPSAS